MRTTPLPGARRPAAGARRGSALAWAMTGLTVLGVLAVAASLLAAKDRGNAENFDQSGRAFYAADGAMQQYFADFNPLTDLSPIPPYQEVTLQWDTAGSTACPSGHSRNASGICVANALETELDSVITDTTYYGGQLQPRDLSNLRATISLLPIKVMESRYGDVYQLQVTSTLKSGSTSHPSAARVVRTYARLAPPLYVRGALTAPNGLTTQKSADHIHIDGSRTKKDQCGSGTAIPALAVPKGQYSLQGNKLHIYPTAYPDVIDDTTATWQELVDSTHAAWSFLTDTTLYKRYPRIVRVPKDYAKFDAINWKTLPNTSTWPVIQVTGDLSINRDIQGWGALIVTGKLTLNRKLDWQGVIITGNELVLDNKAHLHLKGAALTGLACLASDIAKGACRDNVKDEHLGIVYRQCNVDKALLQLYTMEPYMRSRHTRLF